MARELTLVFSLNKPQFESAIKWLKTSNPLEIEPSINAAERILTYKFHGTLKMYNELKAYVSQEWELTKHAVITNKDQIKLALGNLPDKFLPDELKPIAEVKFLGDKLIGKLKGWSVNDKFVKGEFYPVYEREGMFVIGKDGKPYKIAGNAWGKLYGFKK